MDIDDYAGLAASTAIYPKDNGLAYTALGLNGEAGEIAEKVKKILRDKGGLATPEDQQAIAKELGDVLWYVANCANEIGYTLSDIAQMNVDKLQSRLERGMLQGSGDNR